MPRINEILSSVGATVDGRVAVSTTQLDAGVDATWLLARKLATASPSNVKMRTETLRFMMLLQIGRSTRNRKKAEPGLTTARDSAFLNVRRQRPPSRRPLSRQDGPNFHFRRLGTASGSRAPAPSYPSCPVNAWRTPSIR